MSIYPPADIERQPRVIQGGRIIAVDEESPAWDVGLEPGCYITAVDGRPLRDVVDWRWLSADDEITLSYVDLDGEAGSVELWREPGQEWGITFEGLVFDAVKTCRNACVFCFMAQLPEGVRSSLVLRDDDFRLSFLTGTFVTLTNLSAEDEARIIEQAISPLRVSLHAFNPGVRKAMMGKHAQHGIDALERLLDAGIEAHCQIVLVPGLNDGEALSETLAWAYEHPNIVNIGIVPLGYTKHQKRFEESYNSPQAAQAVLDTIAPFQERARKERTTPWVFAADEFYGNAYGARVPECTPPTQDYGSFEMFEDGIGIIRWFLDDFAQAQASGLMERFADSCAQARAEGGFGEVRYIIGEAMQPFFDRLIEQSPLKSCFRALTVANDYFGGNVNVTGLLTGQDVIAAISGDLAKLQERGGAVPLYVVPRVMFNDDGITLDDMTLQDIASAANAEVRMVSCNPTEYLEEIMKG